MIPIKKLRDILQETLTLTADFEQRYHGVSVRFICYQKGQPVHQSTPLAATRLQTELPHICKTVGATELRLVISGSDHRSKAIQLYSEAFRLARTGQAKVTAIHGLGSPALPLPAPARHLPTYGATDGLSGFGGLGAAEVAGLVNKRVSDELLRKEHTDLHAEASELRQRITRLEAELAEQVAVNNSRNMVKEYSAMIAPFAPAIASLLGGSGTPLGGAVLGLGGAGAETTADALPQNKEAGDNEQTRMVTGLVREFMSSLSEEHRRQLLAVMMRIRQDQCLIPRIHQFLTTPSQAGQRHPQAAAQQSNNDAA